MNCPVDSTELQIAERQGIEIDHCPQCRGVWLDRGELDKILERSAQVPYPQAGERYGDTERAPREPEYERRGRRRSLLEDLLDFD